MTTASQSPIQSLVARLLPVLLLSAAACGGGSALRVKTDDAKVAMVARHRTYSQEIAQTAPGTYAKGELTPEVVQEMGRAVDQEMGQRGYSLVTDGSGELVVRIAAGSRTSLDQPTGSAAARGGASATEATERGIVIDIFERATNEQLFHGYGRYDANPASMDEKKVREAVARIAATIPPAAK